MRWIIALLIFPVFMNSGCNSTSPRETEELEAYNDSIIDQHNKIISQLMDLNKHINNLDYPGINKSYAQLLRQTDQSASAIRELGPYENDSLLYKASVELFQYYSDLFHGEYDTIIDILLMGEKNITNDHLEFMDSLSTVIEEKENRAFSKFEEGHERFAERYDLNIIRKENDTLTR